MFGCLYGHGYMSPYSEQFFSTKNIKNYGFRQMKTNKFHVDIKKSLFFAWYRFDIMLLTTGRLLCYMRFGLGLDKN